ncbi:hypothetical protein CKM354_000774000 [Cercospora kikuchii]|uniref:DUF6536 domain-containing protein n=1 Tax=Cercospora kikuchii TaxID=84275 RepID=A0A9P3CHL3_9PEZI|nr:uncharacterized protein CKM354_000774000 [Cercospora kikuchii]GIZ44544.1 hypothetical protein CKM354_000774000 [Cercospora kikuchii]
MFSKYTAWKVGVAGGIGVTALVLVANICLLAWSATRPSSGVTTRIFTGSCKTSRAIDLSMHLFINLLGTILLAAGNNCAQILSAPTREEITQAHRRGRWVDIGVPSVRNLREIPAWRISLWLLLYISSAPLHLIYNSTVFSSRTVNDYDAFVVTESFFENEVDQIRSWPEGSMIQNASSACLRSSLVHMSIEACVRSFTQSPAPLGNALIVTNGSLPGGASILNAFTESWDVKRNPPDWVCSGWAFKVGVTLDAIGPSSAELALVDQLGVIPMTELFRNTSSNAMKHCNLTALVDGTEAWMLPISDHYNASEAPDRLTRWTMSLLICTLISAVGIALLVKGFQAKTTWTYLTFDVANLIEFTLDLSITANAVLPNIPQIAVSFAYLFYNNLVTCMVLAGEYAEYASSPTPLRVSRPKDKQRSTYWLQIPYKYSIPMLSLSALLHWLISRSLFFIKLEVMDPSGNLRQPEKDENGLYGASGYTGVAFSGGAAMIALIIWIVMILALIFYSDRKVDTRIPLAGSCSLAISAACHRPRSDVNAALLPVQYGIFAESDETGHIEESAGFSSQGVEPLNRRLARYSYAPMLPGPEARYAHQKSETSNAAESSNLLIPQDQSEPSLLESIAEARSSAGTPLILPERTGSQRSADVDFESIELSDLRRRDSHALD